MAKLSTKSTQSQTGSELSQTTSTTQPNLSNKETNQKDKNFPRSYRASKSTRRFWRISASRPIQSNNAPIETPAISKQQTEPEDISVPQRFEDPHNDTKIFDEEVKNIDETVTETLSDNTEIPTGVRIDENTGEEIIETTTKKIY